MPREPGIAGKGLHVNFGAPLNKDAADPIVRIAFVPANGGLLDQPESRDPKRFDQIVRDQGIFVGYDCRPNKKDREGREIVKLSVAYWLIIVNSAMPLTDAEMTKIRWVRKRFRFMEGIAVDFVGVA